MSARPRVVIAGAGPAGLFAADRLAAAGADVTVYDRMPSPARKLLLAGRGGLNLTHSEPRDAFLSRYPDLPEPVCRAIDAFPPAALRAFAAALGQPTFVGSSGRVFPEAFKASPLLRAWLARLDGLGVRLVMRHRLIAITEPGIPVFEGPEGRVTPPAEAALLALGGASWPRMGSDGAWTTILAGRGIPIRPFVASNAGVELAWSPAFATRFAGSPLKAVALTVTGHRSRGEAVVTASGLEGGAVYALSSALRMATAAKGPARLVVDLKPDIGIADLATRLRRARPKDSLANVLKKQAGLAPVAVGLLREAVGADVPREADALAALLKAVPLSVTGLRPLERAISSAGGIDVAAVGEGLELRALPELFVAGEMLDWDAPTGGYLLQATFATAALAAAAMARRLGLPPPPAAPGW